MARGRFISESVAKDLRLNNLSVEAQLVYLMTIPHLDRDGLIEGDTEVMYGTVCPKRRIFIDRIGEFIQEWVRVGLVAIYDSDDGPVLWFRGFAKNQLGLRYERETPSKFPAPPGCMFGAGGIVEIPSAPAPSEPPQDPPLSAPASADEETKAIPLADTIRQPSGTLSDADGNGVAQSQVEVKVKSQVKSQVEDQSQAQDVRTAPADSPSRGDVLDPKALIADLRQRQFMYLDKDATAIAARLIADYGWDCIMDAADKAETQHKAKIACGDHGIIAPLAYMRSVLAGTPRRTQQARGVPVMQSMGEASVDKFFARLNGKGH